MVAAVLERCGRLDILVNNAGTNIRRPAHELGTADWHKVLDTNLTSAFLCSKSAYPAMKRNGAGKIINIGSMMSIFGASFAPAYAASKAGIVQFTKSIACAWARDNIQANAVLPGWIEYRADPRRAGRGARPQRKRAAADARGPLGRDRRYGGRCRVPREPGIRLHHRRGNPGRRRLFGAGVRLHSGKARVASG